jgi:hypothetical protein
MLFFEERLQGLPQHHMLLNFLPINSRSSAASRTPHPRRTSRSKRGRSRYCGQATGGTTRPPQLEMSAQHVVALGTATRNRDERSSYGKAYRN